MKETERSKAKNRHQDEKRKKRMKTDMYRRREDRKSIDSGDGVNCKRNTRTAG